MPVDRPCLECEDWPGVVRIARSAVMLAPPADRLVHSFKYEGWEELAGEMASRMIRVELPGHWWSEDVPLVPVPTTRRRRRIRGYNQASVLASAVAEETGAPVVRALVRDDEGGSQVSLHPAERRANVSGAFSLASGAASSLRDGRAILIDDVLTTGATAVAASRVLEAGGAREVAVLTFARSLPDRGVAEGQPN